MLKLNKSMTILPMRLKWPFGWCGHIPFAAWIIEELQPKTFVELGTHTGNSYFAMCQTVLANNLDTKCYAVDTWAGDEHAGEYDNSIYNDVSSHNESNYAPFSVLKRMTFDKALSEFEDNTIDLLHIDGLHTYEAVKHDFETWLPKISKRGVVMFHDTNVYDRNFGVWKLWGELSAKYPSFEFKHSNGLGVLIIGAESISILSDKLSDDVLGKQTVHDLFVNLGNSISFKAELQQQLQIFQQLQAKNEKLKQKLKNRNPIKRLINKFRKRT